MVATDSLLDATPATQALFRGALHSGAPAPEQMAPHAMTGRSISLADLPRGIDALVSEVVSPVAPEDGELVLRLAEIGFVPGEAVRVVAHGFPGQEPLAVRLGATIFALRRFEAAFIRVVPRLPAKAR